MIRSLLLFLLIFIFIQGHSQEDFFVLKKNGHSVRQFRKGFDVTFQMNTGEWVKGTILKIQHDSFYVRPYVLHYTMFGVDTAHYATLHPALTDIYALPKDGAMVVFRDEKPVVIHGHEKFVWIKNGLLMQVAGGGYAAFNIGNNLASGDPPFGKKNRVGLLIAGGVFALGEMLHLTYRKYIYVGKKYKLEYVGLDVPAKKSF